MQETHLILSCRRVLEATDVEGTLAMVSPETALVLWIHSGTRGFGQRCFRNCKNLQAVRIRRCEDSGTRIRDLRRFLAQLLLYEPALFDLIHEMVPREPDLEPTVGASAFLGCSSLVTVELPPFITAIEKQAFSGCTNLRSVDVPRGTECIGTGAFKGCSSLEEVKLPDSVADIGDFTFEK